MSKAHAIINAKSGELLGSWDAENAAEALDLYASDAGYEDFEDACHVASADGIEVYCVHDSADDTICLERYTYGQGAAAMTCTQSDAPAGVVEALIEAQAAKTDALYAAAIGHAPSHWLMSYDGAKQLRRATPAELAASIEAAKHDGGAGVIVLDDGTRAYVEV